MKELNDHIKNLYEEINFFKAERTRNGWTGSIKSKNRGIIDDNLTI
jgi:hypothetical protein